MWYQEMEKVPTSRLWSSASVTTIPHRISWCWQGQQSWRWVERCPLEPWICHRFGYRKFLPLISKQWYSLLSLQGHITRDYATLGCWVGGVQLSDPFKLHSLLSTSLGHISSLLGLSPPFIQKRQFISFLPIIAQFPLNSTSLIFKTKALVGHISIFIPQTQFTYTHSTHSHKPKHKWA